MSNNKSKNIFFQSFKIISNIISWVLLILLVIIAGFLVYYFLSTNACKNREDYCEPKITLYTIISPSMTPTIKVYDVVVNIDPKSEAEINVGDIITFHSTSKLYSSRIVTHRVIEKRINESGITEFKTQGDNNLSPDDTYVPYENVVGKVIFKIPQLGRIQFLLTSTGGWLFLIIIPALLLILYDIIKLFKLFDARKRVDATINLEKKQQLEEKESLEIIRNNLKKKYISSLKYQKSTNEPTNIFIDNKKKLIVNNKHLDIDKQIKVIATLNEESQIIKKKVIQNKQFKGIKIKKEILPNEIELPELEEMPKKVISQEIAKK